MAGGKKKKSITSTKISKDSTEGDNSADLNESLCGIHDGNGKQRRKISKSKKEGKQTLSKIKNRIVQGISMELEESTLNNSIAEDFSGSTEVQFMEEDDRVTMEVEDSEFPDPQEVSESSDEEIELGNGPTNNNATRCQSEKIDPEGEYNI